MPVLFKYRMEKTSCLSEYLLSAKYTNLTLENWSQKASVSVYEALLFSGLMSHYSDEILYEDQMDDGFVDIWQHIMAYKGKICSTVSSNDSC